MRHTLKEIVEGKSKGMMIAALINVSRGKKSVIGSIEISPYGKNLLTVYIKTINPSGNQVIYIIGEMEGGEMRYVENSVIDVILFPSSELEEYKNIITSHEIGNKIISTYPTPRETLLGGISMLRSWTISSGTSD